MGFFKGWNRLGCKAPPVRSSVDCGEGGGYCFCINSGNVLSTELSLPGPGVFQCPLLSIWTREISVSPCLLLQVTMYFKYNCVSCSVLPLCLPLVHTIWLVSLLKAITSNSGVAMLCGVFSLCFCSPHLLLEGKWMLA